MQFILALFVNSCIIFHVNNYQSTFASFCILVNHDSTHIEYKGKVFSVSFLVHILKNYLFIFRARGKKGRKKGRKTSMREINID